MYRSVNPLWALQDCCVLVFMWLGAFGATGVVINGHIDGPDAIAAVLLIPATGFLTYQRLWCLCVWERFDAATLEWSTPAAYGRVPLHQEREIGRESRRFTSIDIQGHRSLFVRVRPDFDDLTASITAGAPHVKIVDNR